MRSRPRDERFLSHEVHEAVADAIEAKQNVLLIHESLGKTATVRCLHCATMLRCERCAMPLLSQMKALRCRNCETATSMVDVCPNCHASGLLMEPGGIAKIRPELERELKKRFPDSTPEVHIWSKTHQLPVTSYPATAGPRLGGGQLPIVLLASSYAFDRIEAAEKTLAPLGLVAVLSLDAVLGKGSYTGAEAVFHRLATLAALVNTRSRTLLIQTRFPTHPVFEALGSGIPEHFFKRELAERTRFGFPPAVCRVSFRLRTRLKKVREEFDSRVVKFLTDPAIAYTKRPGMLVLWTKRENAHALLRSQAELLSAFPGALTVLPE